jgi:hypothetical protein
MDWSSLRKLDFGHGSPTNLLTSLIGLVPNLRTLNFGFWRQPGYPATWNCSDLVVMQNFLMSIDALESVRMFSQDNKEVAFLLPTFLKKYGATLRHLDIDLGTRDALEVEQLIGICEKAPRLESLSTTIRMQEGTKKLGSQWPSTMTLISFDYSPANFQQAITSLRQLKRLNLKVKLLSNSRQLVTKVSCPCGTSGAPSLRLESAKDIVLRLWDDFGSTSVIERLEIVFFAPDPSEKLWTLWVEKEYHDMSPVVQVKEEGDHYNPANYDPFG